MPSGVGFQLIAGVVRLATHSHHTGLGQTNKNKSTHAGQWCYCDGDGSHRKAWICTEPRNALGQGPFSFPVMWREALSSILLVSILGGKSRREKAKERPAKASIFWSTWICPEGMYTHTANLITPKLVGHLVNILLLTRGWRHQRKCMFGVRVMNRKRTRKIHSMVSAVYKASIGIFPC